MLFKKGYSVSSSLFKKGQGQQLFKKGGQFLQDISPALGYVNPVLGIGSNVAGRLLSR